MDEPDERDAAAAPGVDPDGSAKRGRLLYTLDVDGQLFAVRSHDGGTYYDWLSGPNKDYGFGSSGGRGMPEEWHRESIRTFLSMIDPETGFIEDD